jgi:hypothetical protein
MRGKKAFPAHTYAAARCGNPDETILSASWELSVQLSSSNAQLRMPDKNADRAVEGYEDQDWAPATG